MFLNFMVLYCFEAKDLQMSCTLVLFVYAAKAERLRQAKAEAEKEISAYRAEREGAYQKKLAEVGVHTQRLLAADRAVLYVCRSKQKQAQQVAPTTSA